MQEQFERTARVLGEEGCAILARARVLLFGVGGVGGHTAEALARAGVGHITLVDKDVVDVSNINRQVVALHSTVGMAKVEVMKARILDINPDCEVDARVCFFLPDNADTFDFSAYDYVIDAVDNVAAKVAIVQSAVQAGVPVIASMGAGNKLDPTRFRVSDIYKTDVDPLAKVMRTRLRKLGIKSLKCVWSDEMPINPQSTEKRPAPGSLSFVPGAAGLALAGAVVRDLVGR